MPAPLQRLGSSGDADRFSELRRALAAAFEAARPWRVKTEVWLAKRRRAVAVAVSLCLHTLFFLFLLVGAASTMGGGAGGTGKAGSGTQPGMGVELISVRQALPDALKVMPSDADTTADRDAVMVPTLNTDADTLLNTTDTSAIPQLNDASAATKSASPASHESQAGGAGIGGQSSGVDDTLWKQIEPCWRRLATPETHRAMLQVTFSPLGNVAQAADATDATDAATAFDTASQSQASRALAECGPYVGAASREDVVIAFPAPAHDLAGTP